MPTAYIIQSDCRVRLAGERLEIGRRDSLGFQEEVLRDIPLRDLERLVVDESCSLTGPAMAELLRRGVPVNYLGWNGQYLGGFLPAQTQHGLARLRQYRQTSDPAFALIIARAIITAKLYNQRRVLQRLQAGRQRRVGGVDGQPAGDSDPDNGPGDDAETADSQNPETDQPEEVAAALVWLDQMFGRLSASKSIDELRGYEGASAARYFQAWSTFLPAEFPFERRSTRPPLNPVNACISLGATLLYHELVSFIMAHGLDPALGLLHTTEDGRWSLALDLMEPYRPVLVEALTLDLFSRQILRREHFESRDGGCYLNFDGRKRFFLQYERRMERHFMSEAVGHRTTLRQQLEQQAILFKVALEEPGRFEPFLMN